jgi:hypothetical protein
MKGKMRKGVYRIKKDEVMKFLGLPKDYELFSIKNAGCDGDSVAWVEYEVYQCFSDDLVE